MKTLTFYKTNNLWFIDIPWEGDQSDLQMVDGADLLLDILSEGDSIVQVIVSLEDPNDPNFNLLELVDYHEFGGGIYCAEHINSIEYKLTLWLCGVTEYVIGNIPSKIWYLKVENSLLN